MRRWVILSIALLLGSGSALAAHDPEDPEATSYPSLKIGGFTDFNFFVTDDENADPGSGFREGQFVLHFTSALSRRIFFFGELSLTARDSEFRVEVERSIIKLEQSDYFKVSFGRYHTPINWWNNNFHHGQWLQTTVARPEMTRFGGDFIPVHFIGALVEGNAAAGPVSILYSAGIGNGRHAIISRGGDAGDVNGSRAALANLSFRPDALYDLRFGGAYYIDKVSFEEGSDVDENIAAAYVAYTRETPEIIAEYAAVTHDVVDTGETFDGKAFYVQLAWRLPFVDAKFKPYARYEKIDVEVGDPVYANLKDRQGWLGGIRYDLSAFLAVKVEYRHQRSNQDDYVDEAHAQISVAF